jgi:cysteine-rich repeat protein
MTGTCVTGSSEGKEKYHDGCLLGNGSTFSYVQVDDDNNPVTADIDVPTDTALIPCKFGIAGAQPQYSGCLPDQFLGKVEEYTCAPVDTCEEITTVEIADRCGDGLVADTEECDDGNITAGDGCDDKCEEE